ncbi:hypothetical protein C1646_775075 [Rhizophagus diaphanus]|nr:hypothetical protein C1646_775075 [Rhizophagus diaphanus] [Rhizophagus sp. MUCL 43196]
MEVRLHDPADVTIAINRAKLVERVRNEKVMHEINNKLQEKSIQEILTEYTKEPKNENEIYQKMQKPVTEKDMDEISKMLEQFKAENIEKENNYIQENGVLYKIKDENKFKVIRRFELEGVICNNCQRRNNPQGLYELHPIEVKEPFHMIGIDVIGLLLKTEEGNKYIVVAIDFFMKWPEAKAIKEANAKEISKFIYEE